MCEVLDLGPPGRTWQVSEYHLKFWGYASHIRDANTGSGSACADTESRVFGEPSIYPATQPLWRLKGVQLQLLRDLCSISSLWCRWTLRSSLFFCPRRGCCFLKFTIWNTNFKIEYKSIKYWTQLPEPKPIYQNSCVNNSRHANSVLLHSSWPVIYLHR